MPPHGGKREGAGAKEKLDYLARLHVGARAENFSKKIAERKAFAKYRQRSRELGIAQAQAAAAKGIRANGRIWWEESDQAEDYRSDVEFGLATLAGNDLMEKPPRLVSIGLPRYAGREHVLDTVSRWASWYYRRKISPRYVRRCWVDYNRFLAES